MAVGRRAEVRVVGVAGVLRVGQHAIAAQPHAAEVRVLEVSRRFVEAQMEEPIVVPVRDVEQLRHGAAAETSWGAPVPVGVSPASGLPACGAGL